MLPSSSTAGNESCGRQPYSVNQLHPGNADLASNITNLPNCYLQGETDPAFLTINNVRASHEKQINRVTPHTFFYSYPSQPSSTFTKTAEPSHQTTVSNWPPVSGRLAPPAQTTGQSESQQSFVSQMAPTQSRAALSQNYAQNPFYYNVVPNVASVGNQCPTAIGTQYYGAFNAEQQNASGGHPSMPATYTPTNSYQLKTDQPSETLQFFSPGMITTTGTQAAMTTSAVAPRYFNQTTPLAPLQRDVYDATQPAEYGAAESNEGSATQFCGNGAVQPGGNNATQLGGYSVTQLAGYDAPQPSGYDAAQLAGYGAPQPSRYTPASASMLAASVNAPTPYGSQPQTSPYSSLPYSSMFPPNNPLSHSGVPPSQQRLYWTDSAYQAWLENQARIRSFTARGLSPPASLLQQSLPPNAVTPEHSGGNAYDTSTRVFDDRLFESYRPTVSCLTPRRTARSATRFHRKRRSLFDALQQCCENINPCGFLEKRRC